MTNRRLTWLIFLLSFFVYGYFQSGGGWNQNARFAMVRAFVERGELTIDSYLIYVRAKENTGAQLRRVPIVDGGYEINGEQRILMWQNQSGGLCPVNNRLQGVIANVDRNTDTLEVADARKIRIPISFDHTTKIDRGGVSVSPDELSAGSAVEIFCGLDQASRIRANRIVVGPVGTGPRYVFQDLGEVAATGDVAFHRGHFYPNKAPGTSFLAVPSYCLIFWFEKLVHINPDDWWTLTVNAWLTALFSVGLISALGAALFFRVACDFSKGSRHNCLVAVWLFAFGTMFFPNATLLYEHNIIAVALLASFYLIYRVKVTLRSSPERAPLTKDYAARIFLAGLCAGFAAITSYVFIVAVCLLAAYLVFCAKVSRTLFWFALGLLGPFLLVCAYNLSCFGVALTTNYHYQNPVFSAGAGHFLGVFQFPRWDVLVMLLFSPYRGLFFTAPVLIMSIFGFIAWSRNSNLRAEAFVCSGIFVFCLLWNASFNGWDAGVTAVPRYLGPAVPFLCLATLYALDRFFKTTCALTGVSMLIMLLLTTVDIQPPVGTGKAVVLDKPQWQYNPLLEYDLPIFLTQRPMPLLRQQESQVLRCYDSQLMRDGRSESERAEELKRIRSDIDEKINRGEPAPLLLARVGTEYVIADSDLSVPVSPVSTHTFGFYGNWADDGFGVPGSREARWNSFNLGEMLFPESRYSLLPLIIVMAFAAWRTGLIHRPSRQGAPA